MQLIKKVEVNYLRSLYSLNLDDVGDLNVVFGRNDSGKSNFLRALNLFFNDVTDTQHEFDFSIEISDERKKVAREAKGRQFIWIKVTFNVPPNYQSALGDEIAVKRQWNRDGDMNETVFPSSSSPGRQARLTRFLNDIDYTYIPAIKDINVYADLIERMYGAAADTGVLKDATDTFVDAIGEKTNSLSSQLALLFGTSASLAPPTEMKRLFRNLDFSYGDDKHSLLRQKGDGIKARHLPELLRFINETEERAKRFIWGFEEPENSLDLNAAELEAQRFASFAERSDTQIFITSHSPAFYLSETSSSSEIRRYFITKQGINESGVVNPSNAASKIDLLEDAEAKMEKAGLLQLPFIIRLIKEQRNEIEKHREAAGKLNVKLSSLQKPTIFVEGKFDVEALREALSRSGHAEDVSVKQLGGTPSSIGGILNAVLQQGGLSSSAPTIFLFDNDKPGRAAFSKLSSNLNRQAPTALGSRQAAWCLPFSDDFKEFLANHQIQDEQAFFTLEFLFPSQAATDLCLNLAEENHDRVDSSWWNTINGQYFGPLKQEIFLKLRDAERGTPAWLFGRGVPEGIKGRFLKKATQNLSTSAIDEVTKKVIETLQSL